MDFKKNTSWNIALLLFTKVSGWIAVPIVSALFIGRYIDGKYKTGNLYFLVLTGVAFIVSMIGIVRETMKYIQSLNDEHERNKLK